MADPDPTQEVRHEPGPLYRHGGFEVQRDAVECGSPTHHLQAIVPEIVIVEGLANLDALRRDEVTFIALPLKLEGGDGSPVRAIAIEDER